MTTAAILVVRAVVVVSAAVVAAPPVLRMKTRAVGTIYIQQTQEMRT